MTYSRETLSLHSTVTDLLPSEAPASAWNEVRNVAFRNGEAARVSGDERVFPGVSDPVLAMTFCRVSGVAYWLLVTEAHVWVTDGSLTYDVTPGDWYLAPVQLPDGRLSAGTVTYTTCIANGLPVVNASNREPYYWDGNTASRLMNLPDWPAGRTCQAMRSHKNFLFAIGMLDTGGNEVLWSDAAGPGEIPQKWTPAPDNLAGSVVLAPLFEPCLDALTMRDELLIYKRQSIWAASFVGGQFVFAFREVFNEHGLAATGALTRGPDDQHLFVAAVGDVYLTDGTRVASILDGRAQRAFYADFTSEQNPILCAASLQRQKLALVIYPRQGDTTATQALLYDFTSGDIGFRDMPYTLCAESGALLEDVGDRNTWDGTPESWDAAQTVWDQRISVQSNDDVLIGTSAGVFCITSGAQDFASGPVAASLSKRGLAFGAPEGIKQVRSLWPRVTGRMGDTLTFRLMAQDSVNGPVRLGPPMVFTIGQEGPLDGFISGRFLGVEVTSNGGAPWRMPAIDMELKRVGRW
jgi:hypothetical protein